MPQPPQATDSKGFTSTWFNFSHPPHRVLNLLKTKDLQNRRSDVQTALKTLDLRNGKHPAHYRVQSGGLIATRHPTMRGNMICPYCSIEFVPTYPTQKYCIHRHQRLDKVKRRIRNRRVGPPIEYSKTCSICSVGFTTVSPHDRCCSKACGKIHRRRTHDTRSGNCKYRNKKVAEYVYRFKLEHGCSRCLECRPGALQFHHTDPSKKKFNISSSRSKSLRTVIDEILKCVVLCGNCHLVEENGDGYRDADRPKETNERRETS